MYGLTRIKLFTLPQLSIVSLFFFFSLPVFAEDIIESEFAKHNAGSQEITCQYAELNEKVICERANAIGASNANDFPVIEELLIPPQPENFLDRQRIFIDGRFYDLTKRLDYFLSGAKKPVEVQKQSFLALNIESIIEENGGHEFNIRGRAKADLPNTKHRFKVIFESQPDEDISLQNSERVGRLRNDNIASESAVAGVEFAGERNEFQWRPSIDVGSRLDFPLDIFTRFRLRKKTALPYQWLFTTRFEYSYFAREGSRPAVRFSFYKPLNESLSFLALTRYRYTDRQDLQEYFQSIQLNHIVSHSLAMEYKAGVYGDSEPQNQIEGYFTHVAFKNLIYRDWIYFSFIPEVSFLREDDWDPSFALTLQLQVIYSN